MTINLKSDETENLLRRLAELMSPNSIEEVEKYLKDSEYTLALIAIADEARADRITKF